MSCLHVSETLELFKKELDYYKDLGYKVIFVSSHNNIGFDEVAHALEDKITILSGQNDAKFSACKMTHSAIYSEPNRLENF